MESVQQKVRIDIDRQRCRFAMFDPTGCKRCLEVCPVALFGVVPAEKRVPGTAPIRYRIEVTWPEQCNGCGACIKACSYNAIEILGMPVG